MAIAAAATDIYGNRFRGFWASLLGNAFPFAKEGSGVRESLEYVARTEDEGAKLENDSLTLEVQLLF